MLHTVLQAPGCVTGSGCAAQGPAGACGAAVRPGRRRRSRMLCKPPTRSACAAPSSTSSPISLYLPISPQALGVRTVFNILGPLLNPTSCAYFLIGVYSEQLVRCTEI